MATGLAGLALAGCSTGNQLSGSLDELTPLTFTDVVVTLEQGELVVAYHDTPDGGLASGDVPFELSVEAGGGPLDAGEVLDLGALDSSGQPLAQATRSVPGDPRSLPAIQRGTLTLDSPIALGKSGGGHFFLVFEYEQDASLGQGRTVQGSFQAAVEP
ncbi:MAG: hypothetical protein ACYCWW_17210 [Deltaproteobacteria bacterium]